jgi:Uma2 family endonuclease
MLPLKSYPLHTPGQYLERESSAEQRSEYHHGLIYAMAGGTYGHSIVIHNSAFALRLALAGRKCTTVSDLKVAGPSQSSFFYPDLVIHCHQTIPPDLDVSETPNAVIEVLSPSTRAYDLNTKRHVYQSIPTLHTLLYIDSTKRAVLLYERDAKGKWPANPSRPAKQMTLRHFGITISIDSFYAGLDFA